MKVTGDNRPGVESLHPIDQSTLAVSDKLLAFAAQDGPSDSLYLQPWRRRGPARSAGLVLGQRRKVALVHPAGLHFIEVSDPAFSQPSLPSGVDYTLPTEAEIKGVQGMISKNKTPEAMEKGILRAKHDVFVFKDGTIRFDMTDVPLTHFRPKEIGLSVEKARSLGYLLDQDGLWGPALRHQHEAPGRGR